MMSEKFGRKADHLDLNNIIKEETENQKVVEKLKSDKNTAA